MKFQTYGAYMYLAETLEEVNGINLLNNYTLNFVTFINREEHYSHKIDLVHSS